MAIWRRNTPPIIDPHAETVPAMGTPSKRTTPLRPRLLDPERDAWVAAERELDVSQTASAHWGMLERYHAEQARRNMGATRLDQGHARPVVVFTPNFELVACDGCNTRIPLSLMHEVIEYAQRDTNRPVPHRVWYACCRWCRDSIQTTIARRPRGRA